MHIVLAADGHVGSATAKALLKKNQPVTVVLHSEEKATAWKQQGADVAILDVNDTAALRAVFKRGESAFILNPPAPPSTDTVATEKKSAVSILHALENSGIRKVVAESTYGAQPGQGLGDLGVLYELEQGLANRNIPATIIRAAYYMSNWDMSLDTARREGIVHTLYPVNFKLPMVAPDDIGHFAAHFLTEPTERVGLVYVEGPQEYSAADVAAAYAVALDKPVKAVETPQEQWIQALQRMGFSDVAAASMAAMTKITLEKGDIKPAMPNRGATTLQDYLTNLSDSPG